ncbi:hypothetical protein EDD85DRAFT_794362 [Armillaria nabsnona]|nr:hypothetical protein EDD85DRAFT_794362 [Armillaria nabsnona]
MRRFKCDSKGAHRMRGGLFSAYLHVVREHLPCKSKLDSENRKVHSSVCIDFADPGDITKHKIFELFRHSLGKTSKYGRPDGEVADCREALVHQVSTMSAWRRPASQRMNVRNLGEVTRHIAPVRAFVHPSRLHSIPWEDGRRPVQTSVVPCCGAACASRCMSLGIISGYLNTSVDHLTIMYWKLLVVTLAFAREIRIVFFPIVYSDFQALLVVVLATPSADCPTGGAPPPVEDDLFKPFDLEIQTSSGSDPRPSHPGKEWSL